MKNLLALSIVDRIIGGAPYLCEGEFANRIAYAGQAGYDGVELNIADPTRLDLSAISAAAEKSGIKIVAFGTGRAYVNERISLTSPDPAVRSTAFTRVKQFIEVAGRFGSIVIIGCIRGNISCRDELNGALELLGDAMERLDVYAGEKGVTMVFEPINRYENNFLGNIEETADFIRHWGLSHTKILMDTFHMNIEEPDFIRAIETYIGDTAYVHIADSNRKYPGCGHIDFKRIFCAFEQTGYSGPFVAECQARAPERREEDCRLWLEAVRRLTGEVADS